MHLAAASICTMGRNVDVTRHHKLEALNLGCLVLRPKYTIRLGSKTFSVEGSLDSNLTLCIIRLSKLRNRT
jgi:hypothetical protein